MPVDHYENFPVASLLLPARLRPPVTAIYWFARTADDIVDEGDAQPEQRLAQLAAYRQQLDAIAQALKESRHALPDGLSPVFQALAPHIRHFDLPLKPFYDLLDAFAQDVVQARYADYRQLLDYCRRSADPVGRLLLRLYQADSAENLIRSDAICSALQLVNFWQDVAIDWQKGPDRRIYLPQDDLARFGIAEAQIGAGRVDAAWSALMDFQIERSRALMLSGAPLVHALPGRIGWELRLIVQGGLRILEKTQAVGGDVFRQRPVLTKSDWPLLCWRAMTM